MTARVVLEGIKAQLVSGVHPGERWTSWPALTTDNIIMHRVYDEQRRCVAECGSPDIAEVLAAAPTNLTRLTAAIEGVLERHKEVSGRIMGIPPGSPADYGVCPKCFTDDGWPTPYPCPTVRAIENALEGE